MIHTGAAVKKDVKVEEEKKVSAPILSTLQAEQREDKSNDLDKMLSLLVFQQMNELFSIYVRRPNNQIYSVIITCGYLKR